MLKRKEKLKKAQMSPNSWEHNDCHTVPQYSNENKLTLPTQDNTNEST